MNKEINKYIYEYIIDFKKNPKILNFNKIIEEILKKSNNIFKKTKLI